MNKFPFVLAAIALGFLSACGSTSSSADSRFQPNPVTGGTEEDEGPETPIDERIASILQEAKQQYDDGAYKFAFQQAQTAEQLIKQYKFPDSDLSISLTIQGYCLMQMTPPIIEDYFVESFGLQEGALTKFNRALNIEDGDFRALLGIGLAKYRRHGDAIRKAESLGQGIVWLESMKEDARRGFKDPESTEGKRRIQEAIRKLTIFKTNRKRLLELGYIFRDPSTIPAADVKDRTNQAEWLGSLSEPDSELAINDLDFILDDAAAGEIEPADVDEFNRQMERVVKSWRVVRKYWRQQALEDLQGSRNRLLTLRKQRIEASEDGTLDYFWVDRDLTFVFQSLGAFFLDSGLERARLIAIASGVPDEELEVRAREIYLSDDFDDWQKEESKRNYESALDFTKSFVVQHQAFERLRLLRRDDADVVASANSNPFMVDLVSRYKQTMDELIEEERTVRGDMILEAAALCVDPLFQVNDLQRALVWASQYQSLDVDNPLHHFVRATAYYYTEDWEKAKAEYEAFLQNSSLAEDGNRRSLARKRIMQCDQYLDRSGSAGEDSDR